MKNERVEQLLKDYIFIKFKQGESSHHLAKCEETKVIEVDAEDGTYGCETGCEYYRFEAVLECPHEREEFEYGDFGRLYNVIEALEEYENWRDE